ncbi:hypothetical protein [Nocardioides ferulae]|uniref:hypothetical protein n=1 Tax=Nocardioides ferulae TaxID=2340821 RepID=UPI000EAC32D2|nr:hypothetical protein [Nocardioides ferulae]
MPDPFEELETFKQRGLPVDPLPATEVRRRGDRMRRRNNALTAVGGIAAATILVATPLALATDGGSRSDRPIPPASQGTDGSDGSETGWRSSIPGGFPLTYGMPERNAYDGSEVKSVPGYRIESGVAPCGGDNLDVDYPVAMVDAVSVSARQEEGGIERNLLLYEDADAAATVLEEFQGRFEGECPAPRNGPGSALLSAAVGDETLVYVDRWRSEGELTADGYLHLLVRVGNAVLHESTFFGGAGDQAVVAQTLDDVLEESAYPVASMCLFSASPCTELPSEPRAAADAAPIPDGFPLAEGLPEGDQVIGPAPDAGGIDLSAMCGTMRDVWPGDFADRSAVTVTLGDFLRSRELVTFASPDQAPAIVEQLRGAVAACPAVESAPGQESDTDQAYTVLDDGTGADSLSFAMTTQGGQLAAVYRFVAVSGLVLASYISGDFTEAELDSQLADLVEQDAAVLGGAAGLAG